MSQEPTQSTSWNAVAAELRAYREQQKQTWGDLDHALIGRYLAGEVNDEERSRVEAALEHHPELRVLTEVVSGVLADCEPAAVPAPAPVERPRILSLSAARPPRVGRKARLRQLGGLAAAACLLLGLGLTLSQHSHPVRGTGDPFFRDVEARRGLERSSGMPSPGGLTPMSLSGGGEDVVAMATELVDKGQVEKARPLIRSVAKMANRFLESPPSESKIVPVFADDTSKQQQVLQKSLHPLMAGLSQTADPQLQRECASVLARMGENARPAVPRLAETLRQASDAEQQLNLVDVLRGLGPTARPAAPELVGLAAKGCDRVQPRARDALKYVRRPDWIGVRDSAGVLSASARKHINGRLEELSRRHHVAIVAETVRSLPDADRKRAHDVTYFAKKEVVGEVARRRISEVGADQALFLYICMDPPAVQVTLGPEARRKTAPTWKTDAVSDRLEKSVESRDLDRGLTDVVQMIESAITK